MFVLYSIDYGDGYYGPDIPVKTPVAKFSTKALAESYVVKAKNPSNNRFFRNSLLYGGGYEIEEELELPIDPDPLLIEKKSTYIAVINEKTRISCSKREYAEKEIARYGGYIDERTF